MVELVFRSRRRWGQQGSQWHKMLAILEILLWVFKCLIFFLKSHLWKEAINGSLRSHFRKKTAGFMIAVTGMTLETQTQKANKKHKNIAFWNKKILRFFPEFRQSVHNIFGTGDSSIWQSSTVCMDWRRREQRGQQCLLGSQRRSPKIPNTSSSSHHLHAPATLSCFYILEFFSSQMG